MKTIIEKDDKTEGLEKLLGERVTFFCCRYIYTGKLVCVAENFIKLTDCGFVFQTGEFKKKDWDEYEPLPGDFYILTQSIESYGILK